MHAAGMHAAGMQRCEEAGDKLSCNPPPTEPPLTMEEEER